MINPTSAANVQSMLETIRAYQAQAAGQTQQTDETLAPSNAPSFTDSVKSLLDKVNAQSNQADKLQDAYQRGEDVPLTDVVLAMQKSSLSFETTLQVRNKVLKAYEEILNMPV